MRLANFIKIRKQEVDGEVVSVKNIKSFDSQWKDALVDSPREQLDHSIERSNIRDAVRPMRPIDMKAQRRSLVRLFKLSNKHIEKNGSNWGDIRITTSSSTVATSKEGRSEPSNSALAVETVESETLPMPEIIQTKNMSFEIVRDPSKQSLEEEESYSIAEKIISPPRGQPRRKTFEFKLDFLGNMLCFADGACGASRGRTTREFDHADCSAAEEQPLDDEPSQKTTHVIFAGERGEGLDEVFATLSQANDKMARQEAQQILQTQAHEEDDGDEEDEKRVQLQSNGELMPPSKSAMDADSIYQRLRRFSGKDARDAMRDDGSTISTRVSLLSLDTTWVAIANESGDALYDIEAAQAKQAVTSS